MGRGIFFIDPEKYYARFSRSFASRTSHSPALKLLYKKINKFEHRIDCETVNKEEFSEIFKSAYLEIIRTHQDLKREAAVGLIVNALLSEDDKAKLPFDELDHFLRNLELLSAGSLQVLCTAIELYKRKNDKRLQF